MGDLRSVMQGIRDQRGTLTPAVVVDEARDEHHPLHHRFEWDDTVAGEKYRLIQAGALIRKVKVRYGETPDGEHKHVRGYVSLAQDHDDEFGTRRAYQPTEEVLEDPFQRKLLLRNMHREWRQFRARYEHMAEFADLIAGEADDLGEAS